MVVTVPVALLGQTPAQAAPGQAGSAILHTQGGVWVNGFEAADASAIFAGDELETRPQFTANLSLDGSTVQIQPESVGKFQGDVLVLDHGSVAVGTSKGFKVRVNCITVVPVLNNEWTQYEVTDVNGTVQVAAKKLDVRVEFGSGGRKTTKEPETSHDATVREGEQDKYEESGVCGAPPSPTKAGSVMSPKWIGAGAGGAGLAICLLVCFGKGGAKNPVSPWTP
jgi:hypothetical protein